MYGWEDKKEKVCESARTKQRRKEGGMEMDYYVESEKQKAT